MDQKKELRFRVRMTANDLWRFSMYHANKGYLGVFNVLFTLAALFLLVFQSGQMLLPQRLLLVVCALMFTVWQPMLLLVKARKQAAGRGMKEPIDMFFGDEGIRAEQGGESVELAWDDVRRVKKIPGELIIYTDRIHAYLLPDAAVGGQREELNKLLHEKLPKEKCGKI